MARLILRGCVLFVVLCGVMLAVRARATPDESLRALLVPPEGCTPPCWMGIRAGETTADAAEAILQAHPWVESINRTPLNISWRWSGRQPAAIVGESLGLIYLRSESSQVVTTLRIALSTQLGDAWALFGTPQSAQLMRPSRSTAYLLTGFDRVGVYVIASMSCPAEPSAYWAAPVSLHLGEMTFTEVMHNTPYSIFEQPGWWRTMNPCRRVAGL